MTGGFEDRDPVEDYRIINRELEQYGAELSERPQIVVANKCDAPGTADKIADLKRAALNDGHMFFAVSAVTGAGLNTLMLAVGEQVAKLRAELAVSDEPVVLRDDEWERRRLQREKRFRMPFGNDEGMPRKGRVDVQKSQQAIRFVDLRAGQRTLRDPAKKTLVRHNNSCS